MNEDEDKIKLTVVKRVVEIYKGNIPMILRFIQAFYFFDTKNLGYKRVPTSIKRIVTRLVSDYKSENP